MILPLILSYVAMVAVQRKGAEMIGVLWGTEAQEAAVAQNTDDVQPDQDVTILCGGYDKAHFDTTSNILHAAGMVAALYLAISVIVALPLGGWFRKPSLFLQQFLWIWPVYYLPAWVGHLWFQKDIPAVFTYGTTVRGWAVGEYCAFHDLFAGGVVSETIDVGKSAVLTYLFIVAIEAAVSSSVKLTNTSSEAAMKTKKVA
jgi:hypothetical protein